MEDLRISNVLFVAGLIVLSSSATALMIVGKFKEKYDPTAVRISPKEIFTVVVAVTIVLLMISWPLCLRMR